MPPKLAVVIIHGIGSQDPDFTSADKLKKKVSRKLEKAGKDAADVVWQKVYWADILEDRQLDYITKARQQSDIDLYKLRKFVVTAFGDAVAYRYIKDAPHTTYYKIHAQIRIALHELYHDLLARTSVPLIFMAHSLGGHIMSNYIWDIQNPKPDNPVLNDINNLSSFEKFQTLTGVITFGCNIPLFIFANSKVQPIRFPPESLSDDLKPKARWMNFYDPDDILGYPLRPIEAYAEIIKEEDEKAINSGGWASNWNPMSHGGYWTDNDFAKAVAEYFGQFI